MVRWITDKAAFDAAVAGDKPIIIDFTASWCAPCKMIGPVFEELSKSAGGLQFAKVDVDVNKATAATCGIKAMPTFQVWKGGQKQEEFSSADRAALTALIGRWDFPASADDCIPGDVVILQGLVSKPELNGVDATVQPRETWPANGRISVLPKVEQAAALALKPANIALQTLPDAVQVAPGSHVVVDGLQSKPELNRKRGVIVPGGENGRVIVQLASAVSIAAKPANLAMIRRASDGRGGD